MRITIVATLAVLLATSAFAGEHITGFRTSQCKSAQCSVSHSSTGGSYVHPITARKPRY